MLTFVTLKTKDHDGRQVTIAYSHNKNQVTLLGELPHASNLVIDQELVDDLQKIVNLQKKQEG